MAQDLTEDHEGEESTACACRGICRESCACYRAHGICQRSCSCKGEGCCALRFKVTKHLFGSHNGIKLTSCFAKEISTYAGAHWDSSLNPVGLSMMFAASRMDTPDNFRGYFRTHGPFPTMEEEFKRKVGELVDSLQSKVLEFRNRTLEIRSGNAPYFPFKMTSGTRGSTALVSWYNKWQDTSASPTPLKEQLTRELLRFALTEDPSHNCYYSFCTGQWESKSTTRHCEGCGRCVQSQRTHCAICRACVLGDLDQHQKDCYGPD